MKIIHTMGNSGSVHRIQSSLKELSSYYHVKTDNENGDIYPGINVECISPIEDRKKLGYEKSKLFCTTPNSNHSTDASSKNNDFPAKISQVKVLPNLTENRKLRSTTNGAILLSGGTISGRKDLLSQQPRKLERSKTFITNNSIPGGSEIEKPILYQRAQTQLSIDLKKTDFSNKWASQRQSKEKDENTEISTTSMGKINELNKHLTDNNPDDLHPKATKSKLRFKKRKAPSIPLSLLSVTACKSQEPSSTPAEKKERLFGEKVETATRFRERKTETVRCRLSLKPVHASNSLVTSLGLNSSNCSNFGFRREKSFDTKLLSSKTDDNSLMTKKQYTAATLPLQQPANKSLIPKTKVESLEETRKNQHISKNYFDFNTKLKVSRPKAITKNKKLLGDRLKTQTKQSGNNSKIPQLKKTFYFGMENTRQISIDTSHNQNAIGDEYQSETMPLKEENIVREYRHNYFSSQKQNSNFNDNGILVYVRPTLPRRQLKLPRFSPIAAWRTLSKEYKKQALENSSGPSLSPNLIIDSKSTYVLRDRIHRTYREPCSLEDVFFLEKPIQPRNMINMKEQLSELHHTYIDDISQSLKKVRPFLSPWTPEQDLEEDEEGSSSDSDDAVKMVNFQTPPSAHVFSLSLPRENPFSFYGNKNGAAFRSLQKLKHPVSGKQNPSNLNDTHLPDLNTNSLNNYHNDNWVLSKAGTRVDSNKTQLALQRIHLEKNFSSLGFPFPIQSTFLSSLARGRRVMYLPNRNLNDHRRQSLIYQVNKNLMVQINSKNSLNKYQLHSQKFDCHQFDDQKTGDFSPTEFDVMGRVEEEFQKKREYEKESIRHQLQLYSLQEGFTSDVLQSYIGVKGSLPSLLSKQNENTEI